jgi:hypothetical protein
MIQIDGPQRRVYIKLDKIEQVLDLLQLTGGQMSYTSSRLLKLLKLKKCKSKML